MSSLIGRRVVVTRAHGQADELSDRLRRDGAVPVRFPTIEIRPPESFARLDAALRTLHRYDWVLYTSVNGVRGVARRRRALGLTGRAFAHPKVAAIGQVTATALQQAGVSVQVVPEEYRGERLAEALGDVRGARILLLRARQGREALPAHLRAGGAVVDDVGVYRTGTPSPTEGELGDLREGFDAITFTSSATVRGFVTILGDGWREAVAGAAVISIGPITSRTARQLGLRIDAEAREYTLDGVMEALQGHFATGTPEGARPAVG